MTLLQLVFCTQRYNFNYITSLLYVMTSAICGQSYFGLPPLHMVKLFSENKVILVKPVFRSVSALEFVVVYLFLWFLITEINQTFMLMDNVSLGPSIALYKYPEEGCKKLGFCLFSPVTSNRTRVSSLSLCKRNFRY